MGFNGQNERKQCVAEVIGYFSPDGFIETGTWTGNTTGYLSSRYDLPVHTCEINRALAAVAKMRLKNFDKVRFGEGDSRAFLRKLAENPDRPKRPFVYLDAHWYEDLPLEEELRILSKHWDDFLVLVDDFEVPGDAGYEFDDYGNGVALNFAQFNGVFSDLGLVSALPTLPSAQETGAKRGYIFLCKGDFWNGKLKDLTSIKKH